MRLSLDDCGRRLALARTSLTFEDARLLLLDAYRRFRSHSKYGGDMVETLIKVEMSILHRASDQELRRRLAMVKEWF
ncbi:MAG: hypothetical protein VKI93_06570 [Synechococcus sp.]|nr:hypothetical protein [Synechococcus sp.]